jgi:hypothetical protein
MKIFKSLVNLSGSIAPDRIFFTKYIFILSLFFLSAQCSKESAEPAENPETTTNFENGIRIAWDYSTRQKLAPLGSRVIGYCGYPRMIETHDHQLLCVYETSDGNSEIIRSADFGKSWSSPQIIFKMENEINQAVPEIIELKDNSILVACNPRPRNAPQSGSGDPNRRFGIKVRRSTDGGINWGAEKLLYQAGSAFGDGCWEPSFLQLPSGEVQLYFSNEGVYLSSNEQNISIFRSFNNGETWTTEPEITSFTAGKRDGMPVPLYLSESKEIIYSIEDNVVGEFKPSIIRSSLENNWKDAFVSGINSRRHSALRFPLPSTIYAGAPYIRQLKSGEIILGCQSTEGRTTVWDRACLAVYIGDKSARNFDRKTVPFAMPTDKSGLWNSLSVLSDGSVVALTTTNAYSSNSTEVWMIKGHIIPVLSAKNQKLTVDGQFTESLWNENLPVFVGHLGNSQLKANMSWDAENLYFITKVADAKVISETGDPETDDAVKISLDIVNKGFTQTFTGTYALILSADGRLKCQQGKNRNWQEWKPEFPVKTSSKLAADGYWQEVAIPWSNFKIAPKNGNKFRVNFTLIEDIYKGLPAYTESLTGTDAAKPFSWCEFEFLN